MNPPRLWFSALLAGTIAAVSSCGDPTPVGVRSPPLPLEAQSVRTLVKAMQAGLISCIPLPYDSVTQAIGPKGGNLSVGPHKLTVPRGALAAPVSITAVAPSDTVNRVQFRPEGLSFAKSASLTMSYLNCPLLGSTDPRQVAHTDDALQILQYLPSTDQQKSSKVTGTLEHFSNYAVAW